MPFCFVNVLYNEILSDDLNTLAVIEMHFCRIVSIIEEVQKTLMRQSVITEHYRQIAFFSFQIYVLKSALRAEAGINPAHTADCREVPIKPLRHRSCRDFDRRKYMRRN